MEQLGARTKIEGFRGLCKSCNAMPMGPLVRLFSNAKNLIALGMEDCPRPATLKAIVSDESREDERENCNPESGEALAERPGFPFLLD
jgi:hypothetical protein